MAKAPASSPAWGKWWFDKWYRSTLRKKLRTPARRGIYREFWDLCMSSPDPGKAVHSSGEPYTLKEIAEEIGCRTDTLRSVLETGLAHGRCTLGAGLAHGLSTIDAEKSLPDHWRYKRLRGTPPECEQNNDAPNQNQSQNQSNTPPLPPSLEVDRSRYPDFGGQPAVPGHVTDFHARYKQAIPSGTPAVPTQVPRSFSEAVSREWDQGFVESVTEDELRRAYGAIERRFWGPNTLLGWLEKNRTKVSAKPRPPSDEELWLKLGSAEKQQWQSEAVIWFEIHPEPDNWPGSPKWGSKGMVWAKAQELWRESRTPPKET